MSNKKTGNGVGPIVKALLVTVFKLLAIVFAFIFRIAGLILTKISELLEKTYSHGNH